MTDETIQRASITPVGSYFSVAVNGDLWEEGQSTGEQIEAILQSATRQVGRNPAEYDIAERVKELTDVGCELAQRAIDDKYPDGILLEDQTIAKFLNDLELYQIQPIPAEPDVPDAIANALRAWDRYCSDRNITPVRPEEPVKTVCFSDGVIEVELWNVSGPLAKYHCFRGRAIRLSPYSESLLSIQSGAGRLPEGQSTGKSR